MKRNRELLHSRFTVPLGEVPALDPLVFEVVFAHCFSSLT
jgi:hypothetical protein